MNTLYATDFSGNIVQAQSTMTKHFTSRLCWTCDLRQFSLSLMLFVQDYMLNYFLKACFCNGPLVDLSG